MTPSTPIRATARTWPAAAALGFARRAVVVLGAVVALGACEGDDLTNEPIPDSIKPTVKLAKAPEQSDTTLVLSVNATDNIGLKSIEVRVSGGVAAAYDTTFTSAITAANLALTVNVPASATIGSTVNIRAIAFDGRWNASDTAYLVMTVGNLEPPQVLVTSPVAGSPVVSGKALVLALSARARYKVRTLGFQISGAYNHRDSVNYGAPLKDSVATLDTLVIPDTVTGPNITVTPFIVDSLLQRVTGPPVSYSVQSASNANTVPVVFVGVSKRVEVSDTIFVEATDPVGVSSLGYEIRSLTGQLIVADSVSSTGSFSTLVRTFRTRLPITVFPTNVIVTGFARNANGRRDVNRYPSGALRQDTVAVVGGYTNPLPNGGKVADALYFPRNDRLYLTNIDRNQLEVFNLADSTFRQAINVGSRPWGISAWPRNRDGTMGDTLLVANSGGTNISYVNLNSGTTGREVFRYALPNIIVYSITTVKSATTDAPMKQRTVYDFSDRPQFLATTCTSASAPGSPCQDVIVAYSTTPTPGQSAPFPNKGTMRWENLTKRSSHFFFEQAMGQSQGRADTLEIERFAAAGFGSDSVLVPYQQTITTPTGSFPYSVVVRIDQLAFRDTTYVRNSGDFRRCRG